MFNILDVVIPPGSGGNTGIIAAIGGAIGVFFASIKMLFKKDKKKKKDLFR